MHTHEQKFAGSLDTSVKTITTDNGNEFGIEVRVFFTHTYASWQKGAVENTNKLIRQYIPKNISFTLFPDKNILFIQNKLNRKLRQKLDFSTPIKEFAKHF